MLDENGNEINDDLGEAQSRTDNRVKDLADKVKTASTERDEANAKLAEAEAKALEAEKERDFYSSFSDSATQYPEAVSYKDAIKERVMGGLSVEEATILTLAKEGKYTAPTPEPEKQGSPAGGSATTAVAMTGDKPTSELTRDELREKLVEAEARGDLSLT